MSLFGVILLIVRPFFWFFFPLNGSRVHLVTMLLENAPLHMMCKHNSPESLEVMLVPIFPPGLFPLKQ